MGPLPSGEPRGPAADAPSSDKLANLVLQGGGALGIAHVGAISAMEERGYRFVGLAGASAGAIVAMLMAASREDIREKCGDKLRSLLVELPASDFIDGPAGVRRLLKRVIPGRKLGLADLALLPGCWQAFWTLSRRYGLNSGDAFFSWLEESMRVRFGVASREDLEERVRRTAESALTLMEEEPLSEWTELSDYLALTATALPVGLRLILPRHVECFEEVVKKRGPAEWVRASMSVPGFFEPVTWGLPPNGEASPSKHDGKRLSNQQDFKEFLDPHEVRELEELDSLTLMDGGLLSNFPVDAFSQDFLPPGHPIAGLPTVGLMLTQRSRPRRKARGLFVVKRGVMEMIDAARVSRDREARARMRRREWAETKARSGRNGNGAPPRRLSTLLIPIDPDEHNWLDFSLSEEAMDDLYARGHAAAVQALDAYENDHEMEGASHE